MKDWIKIAPIEDIPLRAAKVFVKSETKIAVFRTKHDTFFALEDKCPHKGGPISEGFVGQSVVHCPLHDWSFELESGQARYPDKGCIRRFPISVSEGYVHIQF